MKNSIEEIEEFLSPRKIIVAGASRNHRKFGNIVLKNLREQKFALCPVNPNADRIDGLDCHHTIDTVPDDYTRLLIITPRNQTEAVLRAAAERGICHVWVQQGSECRNIEALVQELKISVVYGQCILMFAGQVKGIHKFHQTLCRWVGLYPK